MHELTTTVGIVALAAIAVAAISLVLGIVGFARLRRLRGAQRILLGAHGESDLIQQSAELTQAFQALRDWVEDVAAGLESRLGTVEERLDGAIAYRALLRYDAYNEMSGRQSTSIALLDASRSGIILSSIHHREQARVYAKQIRAGRSEVQLSPEEEEAMRMALAGEVQEAPR